MTQAANRNADMTSCYQRGMQLMTVEKNHDYAHVLFAQCVTQAPANPSYAEALLKNLREKFPDRKRKPTAFSLGGGNRALKKAIQAADWGGVIRLGIDALKCNPWDVTTLRSLAEACAAQHHNEVELVFLKQALDADPKNVEVNRHCGRSLARMGQFDQAIACWHRVETIKGKDEEAARMISQLAAEKLQYPGGRPPATQTVRQPIGVPADECRKTAELPELSLTPRQLLQRTVAESPRDVTAYLDLTNSLIESEEFTEAEGVLTRAISVCGEQAPLMQKLTHVRALLAMQIAAIAEQAAACESRQELMQMGWLELALASAVTALALQVFPSVAAAAWTALDFRTWSHKTWLLVNSAVIALLIFFRSAPAMRAAWQENRRERRRAVARRPR